MKNAIVTLMLLFCFNLFAEENKQDHSQMDHSKMDHSKMKHDHGDGKHDHSSNEANVQERSKEKVVIKVKGMVCSFCAQGVEKNFNKLDEVKSTKVDLDKMEVTVHFKKGKSLDEKKIKEVVTGAGFAFVEAQ